MDANKSSSVNPAFEKYSTPVAVLLGSLLIASALYWGDRAPAPSPGQPVADQGPSKAQLDSIAPITDKDHIRGNRDAEVFIVEYSDTECPFCKRFHETLKQVVSQDSDGKVAWVYRHFPLDALHKKARSEAVALECANELGGNEAFWKYADRLFEITPANDGLDPAELPKIAAYVGLDVGAFSACASSNRYDAHIQSDLDNAAATGGNGTPWSVIITKSGKKYPLSGAQPLSAVQQLVDAALKQ